jgi:hypothetical protein
MNREDGTLCVECETSEEIENVCRGRGLQEEGGCIVTRGKVDEFDDLEQFKVEYAQPLFVQRRSQIRV